MSSRKERPSSELLTRHGRAMIGGIPHSSAKNDPTHFGTLHIALLTLFRCSTFEVGGGWSRRRAGT